MPRTFNFPGRCSGVEGAKLRLSGFRAAETGDENVSSRLRANRDLTGATKTMNPMRQIGPYHLLHLLGEGGMGKVYLAEDTRLGRKVALKLLPPELTQDKHRVLRFQQEARTASSLNHPNILTIFDIGEVESTHFIATEFVKGETLRERMATTKMSLQEILDVVIQVASALAAAHEAGVVHRDIKPENIMVRRDGFVKVLDFGLA